MASKPGLWRRVKWTIVIVIGLAMVLGVGEVFRRFCDREEEAAIRRVLEQATRENAPLSEFDPKWDELEPSARARIAAAPEGKIGKPQTVEHGEPGENLGHNRMGNGSPGLVEAQAGKDLEQPVRRQASILPDAPAVDFDGERLRVQAAATAVAAGACRGVLALFGGLARSDRSQPAA